jgi:hypothetical protein
VRYVSSYPLVVCAAVAILAGCSAGGSAPSALGSAGFDGVRQDVHGLHRGSTHFTGLWPRTPHVDRHKSWRSPELKADNSARLLFVTDAGTNDLYVFNLPALTLMATITGLNLPQGECSDDTGHVWVTNTNTYQIFEYDHSATVVNTLTDPSGYPVGCAWDKTTGNLAVSNNGDFGSGQGEILVYPGATGTPRAYTDPDLFYGYFAGYDGRGNLFVDGYDATFTNFVLAKLPTNANALSTITISGGTIYDPGTVQWIHSRSGSYLMVGDQECGGTSSPEVSCMYAVSLSRLTGTITGTTYPDNSLGAAACDVVQAVRNGDKLYGGDIEYAPGSGYSCTSATQASTTNTWPFPALGLPLRTSTSPAESEPLGAAISNP